MQLPTQLIAILITYTGTTLAAITNGNVGYLNCNLAPNDPSLSQIDCSSAYQLENCNEMCSYQGNNADFWPGKHQPTRFILSC